jgi:hypothetical protein
MSFADKANLDVSSGNEVWIDGTTAEAVRQNWPGISAHFDASEVDDFPKHPIRFYRWKRGRRIAAAEDIR